MVGVRKYLENYSFTVDNKTKMDLINTYGEIEAKTLLFTDIVTSYDVVWFTSNEKIKKCGSENIQLQEIRIEY